MNLKDDWTTMNYMNCSNADSKTIASDIDSSQENKDAKLKCSCDNKKNVVNIIDFEDSFFWSDRESLTMKWRRSEWNTSCIYIMSDSFNL